MRGVGNSVLLLTALCCLAARAGADQCADCHPDIAATYRLTGMARSFAPAGDTLPGLAADGRATFFHAASHRWYALERRGGAVYLRRHQIGPDSKETNLYDAAPKPAFPPDAERGKNYSRSAHLCTGSQRATRSQYSSRCRRRPEVGSGGSGLGEVTNEHLGDLTRNVLVIDLAGAAIGSVEWPYESSAVLLTAPSLLVRLKIWQPLWPGDSD